MAILRNTAEGGTSGTAVAADGSNTGGSSGNALSGIIIGGTGTILFDGTTYQKGSRSYRFNTVAGYACEAFWTLATSTKVCAFRLYINFTARPPAGQYPQIFRLTNTSGGTAFFAMGLHPDGYLAWTNHNGTTTIMGNDASPTTITLNQWYRIEGWVNQGTTGSLDTGDGTAALKVCTGANIDTDAGIVADFSPTITAQNFGGSYGQDIGRMVFGKHTVSANLSTFYIDGLGFNPDNTTLIGPSDGAQTLLGIGIPSQVAMGTGTLTGGSSYNSTQGLWNTAEGKTANTPVTVANSGGTAGTPWNYVVIGTGTGAEIHYSATTAADGTISYSINSGTAGTPSATYLGWDTEPSNNVSFSGWFRFPTFIEATGGVTQAVQIIRFQTGNIARAILGINSNGALIIGGDITGFNIWQSDTVDVVNRLQTNTWYKFNLSITNGVGGIGVAELRTYLVDDVVTGEEPVETANDFAVNSGTAGFLFTTGVIGQRGSTGGGTGAEVQVTGLSTTVTGANFGTAAIDRIIFGRASNSSPNLWPKVYVDNIAFANGSEPPPVGNPQDLFGIGIPSEAAVGLGRIAGDATHTLGSYEDVYTDVYGSTEVQNLALEGVGIPSQAAMGLGTIGLAALSFTGIGIPSQATVGLGTLRINTVEPPPPGPQESFDFIDVYEPPLVDYTFVIGTDAPDWVLPQIQQPTINMRLKDGCSVDFTLNQLDPLALRITELETDLWVFRDKDLIFRGRIGPSQDQLNADGGTASFTANDYRNLLKRRFFYDDDEYFWYQEDVAVIVQSCLNTIQGRTGGDYGITMGLGSPLLGVVRTEVEFTPGSSVAAGLDSLQESKVRGFDWEIDPLLKLNLWKQRGVHPASKQIEYTGAMTTLTRNFNTDEFANAIRASGGEIPVPEVVEAATLPTDTRGRWEAEVSWPDVETQEVMDDRTAYLLEQVNKVPEEYSCDLVAGHWTGRDHLWLGDELIMPINYGRLSVTKTVRIHEITISPDGNGGEAVKMIVK